MRFKKIKENSINAYKINGNHEKNKIQLESYENHENHRSPC